MGYQGYQEVLSFLTLTCIHTRNSNLNKISENWPKNYDDYNKEYLWYN